MDTKTASERRSELLTMARELISVMREIIEPINKISCRLDAEASLLSAEAADETVSAPRKKKIVYRQEPNPEASAGASAIIIPKRTCSICRKPGHRATTCPERDNGM